MLHNFKNDKPECKYTGALGTALSVSLWVYMWNEGVSVSGAQAPRGNGQCALSRNNSCLSNTKSPARSKRPPLGQQRPLHLSPPSASFPPFTCGLSVALAPDEAAKLKNYNRTEKTSQKKTPTCALFSVLFTLSTK